MDPTVVCLALLVINGVGDVLVADQADSEGGSRVPMTDLDDETRGLGWELGPAAAAAKALRGGLGLAKPGDAIPKVSVVGCMPAPSGVLGEHCAVVVLRDGLEDWVKTGGRQTLSNMRWVSPTALETALDRVSYSAVEHMRGGPPARALRPQEFSVKRTKRAP